MTAIDAIDQGLLEACREGSLADVRVAIRTFKQRYLGGGPPPAELIAVIGACADGLIEARGDAAIALVMFLFDVLMYVPPALRGATEGPAADVVRALEAATPRLSALRDSSDALLAAWAWHLLSWMPRAVHGLTEEALARLSLPARPFVQVTLAFAAASTPEGRARTTEVLSNWLSLAGEERDVAAMVLAQLVSEPTRPETTTDAHYSVLLALSERERWKAWEAAPAREHGYFADLASCLVRAGYARADTTLPALLRIVDACAPEEMEHVLDLVLRLFYQAAPYEGAPLRDALIATQRSALAALVSRPSVWAPRPRFYAALDGLGLPLGAAPLATFLGIEPPATPSAVVVTSVANGVLDVDTDERPEEVAAKLTRR